MFELKVEDFGFNGEGIVHINGKVGFVKYVLPGEKILAEVLKENSRYYVLQLKKVLSKNKFRVSPFCPYFGKCGGCDFQHTSYKNEIEIKKEILSRQLAKIGIKTNIICIASDEYFYRNKIRLYPSSQGLGYYTDSKIITIETCKIASPLIDENIKAVNDFSKPYLSFINYVEIRTDDKKILINFFVKERFDANFEELSKNIKCNYGIYQTVNKKSYHCYGESSLEYSQELKIKPTSFSQINNKIAVSLYRRLCEIVKDKVVANCYSGAGLLSLQMLQSGAKQVYGIELGLSEHLDAQELKNKNKLNSLINLKGDCAKILPKISRKIDLIVVDPPRAGCDNLVIEAIKDSSAKEMVYISCNHATFARDLKRLENYSLERIELFDMFPKTANFEIFAYLRRK